MLPESSRRIHLLAEGEERLAIVIEITVSADGAVADPDVHPALVVNHAKLAYTVSPPGRRCGGRTGTAVGCPWAGATAADSGPSRAGAEDAAAPTGRVDPADHRGACGVDGDVLADLRADEKIAKELIEDFMIAANAVTAQYLDRKAFPSLRRVLRTPERWNRIVELAQRLDAHLPSSPSAAALEEFLRKRQQVDPQRFPDLSLCIIKLLGRGEYALERPGQPVEGHFGLAVKDYTHSTAPNRRFPDLVTQRLLKAALTGQPVPYTGAQLGELARHCTEQEDNATKVERRVRKSAAAFLLKSRLGNRFDAVVTGASAKGTWVRIDAPATEGRVVRGYEGLDVGDRTRVELVDTDVERGFVDFARVETT
jgi:exoribonuclease-2